MNDENIPPTTSCKAPSAIFNTTNGSAIAAPTTRLPVEGTLPFVSASGLSMSSSCIWMAPSRSRNPLSNTCTTQCLHPLHCINISMGTTGPHNSWNKSLKMWTWVCSLQQLPAYYGTNNCGAPSKFILLSALKVSSWTNPELDPTVFSKWSFLSTYLPNKLPAMMVPPSV